MPGQPECSYHSTWKHRIPSFSQYLIKVHDQLLKIVSSLTESHLKLQKTLMKHMASPCPTSISTAGAAARPAGCSPWPFYSHPISTQITSACSSPACWTPIHTWFTLLRHHCSTEVAVLNSACKLLRSSIASLFFSQASMEQRCDTARSCSFLDLGKIPEENYQSSFQSVTG